MKNKKIKKPLSDPTKYTQSEIRINNNLPTYENPPPPPPKKVIIQPPPQAKVKGLYVDADDYFRSYMRQKFDEEQIPTQYSIIGLLVVVIVLLVYCIIKVS
jgi:hypothetical protein